MPDRIPTPQESNPPRLVVSWRRWAPWGEDVYECYECGHEGRGLTTRSQVEAAMGLGQRRRCGACGVPPADAPKPLAPPPGREV
jgi:hypothetical protein